MSFRTIALVGLACLGLMACEQKVKVMTPEARQQMLDDLKAAKFTLDCGFNCRFTWGAKASSLHATDMAESWEDLAVGVMQIGYGNDLAYYYLGQAAQGLKYHEQAIKYYQYSLALATGTDPSLQCATLENGCNGIDLPTVIPVLIKYSQDQIAAAKAAAARASAPAPAKKPAAAPALQLPPPPLQLPPAPKS